MAIREYEASGLEYLRLVTMLLHRVRLADRTAGAWEAADAPAVFSRFCSRATAHLGDLIGLACTINELNLIGVMGYALGSSPPGVKDDFARHLAVNETIVRAHRLAVNALLPDQRKR